MRVISGKARGRKLKMVPGDTTRPIMDRVKENLFNIVGNFTHGTRWLDLFAGTGQVGIEALSRGAAQVVFVDAARAAVRTIHDNLRLTNLAEGAEVRQVDAFAVLDLVEQGGIPRFDCIYVAPPQYLELWQQVVARIDADPAAFLLRDGLVVVQIDPREYAELELARLQLEDKRKYGNTLLCFYEMIETSE